MISTLQLGKLRHGDTAGEAGPELMGFTTLHPQKAVHPHLQYFSMQHAVPNSLLVAFASLG